MNFTKAQETKKYKPTINRILFLLDASGSMTEKWGDKTKFESAKELLYKLVDSTEQKNPNVEFAVRVFGFQFPREQRNCKDSKLLLPFAKNNAAKLKAELAKIHPQGMTPIAYSIAEGAKDFPVDNHSLNSIILITDGNENCEGNPCATSQQLAEKRIALKPFIIGLGVAEKLVEKFNCVGTFFDTKEEASLQNALGVIIKQTLNTTTAQLNLLDKNGNPTVTNIAFTLYDHSSGKVEYNFIHTLDAKGNPDTLYLDPVGVYDIEVHSFPSVRKEGIELTIGKHNIIAIDVPLADLNIQSRAANKENDATTILRPKKDLKTILNVQAMNQTQRYITEEYREEILTTPEIVLDTVLLPSVKNERTIPAFGILAIQATEPMIASVYRMMNAKLEMVLHFETAVKMESIKLQPGEYLLVHKPKKSLRSEATKSQKINIEESRVTTIIL